MMKDYVVLRPFFMEGRLYKKGNRIKLPPCLGRLFVFDSKVEAVPARKR